jgi:hypothetical protein
MALGFSSGLLTGLQQYGQGEGIPADPRQRDAMQAAGVTNPLLQQFGRGLGGMFGVLRHVVLLLFNRLKIKHKSLHKKKQKLKHKACYYPR